MHVNEPVTSSSTSTEKKTESVPLVSMRKLGILQSCHSDNSLEFLTIRDYVESLEELMRMVQKLEGSSSLLWANSKVQLSHDKPTSSSVWVCQHDVLDFARHSSDGDEKKPMSCQKAMTQPLAWRLFLEFLNVTPGSCGFVMQSQRMNSSTLRRATWRTTDKANLVSDVMTHHHLLSVSGHGAHKRELTEKAAVAREVKLPRRSDDVHFAAITMLSKHRCCRIESVCGGPSTSDASSDISLTSAAGLQVELKK